MCSRDESERRGSGVWAVGRSLEFWSTWQMGLAWTSSAVGLGYQRHETASEIDSQRESDTECQRSWLGVAGPGKEGLEEPQCRPGRSWSTWWPIAHKLNATSGRWPIWWTWWQIAHRNNAKSDGSPTKEEPWGAKGWLKKAVRSNERSQTERSKREQRREVGNVGRSNRQQEDHWMVDDRIINWNIQWRMK